MFELSNLKNPPFRCEFLPHEGVNEGEGVEIFLNLDYLTTARIDKLNEIIVLRAKESITAPAEPKRLEAPENSKTDKKRKSRQKNADIALDAEKSPEELVREAAATIALLPAQDIYYYEKQQMRFRAEMLGGMPGDDNPEDRLIYSWNVVNGGVPVPVCFETFFGMSEAMQKALFAFCTSEAPKPTKKNGSK